MPAEYQTDNIATKNTVSPRELVLKYVRYLPWVVVSVAMMLVLAWVKLRYSAPVYSVSSKLLVKSSGNPYSGGSNKYDDIFSLQGGSGVSLSDEIEVIKSRSMAQRVVEALNLQTSYLNKGKIRATIMHPADMPFLAQPLLLKDSTAGFSLLVDVVNEQEFRLNKEPELHHFGEPIALSFGNIIIKRTLNKLFASASNEFVIGWQPLQDAAANLSGSIGVAQTTDYNSNVLIISYETENTRLGRDIVNQFMTEYQEASLEDKRLIAKNTLDFIDEQLRAVKGDLGGVERNLQGFQEQNRIINPEKQGQAFFDELSGANKQLVEQGVKLKVVDYLSNYISDKANPYRKVPSVLGIEEPSLMQQVSEFNKLQLERETALKTTPATNPLIQNYDAGIEKLRDAMLTNLHNIRNAYEVALGDIRKTSHETDQQLRSMPGKQKQLLEVTRQQKILEELYSYLLQKKLETSISSASTISNIKVLEPAMASGLPVSPNRKGTYTMFLLVGLAIPIGIIFLLEYLNDKVKGREDVERVTATPILGEIGHTSDGNTLVVTPDNRDYIAEQFRIVRSNLQYMLPKSGRSVILVTSSFSGEGKSFVSTNLGAVQAISGKQTVILEFDIRKPKVMAGLNMEGRKGITNFIVGDVPVKDIIYPVPGQENLFVIPCGPVPPNPAELLLDEKVASLMEMLRMQFDCIIIDSAPVGMVSDAITLGRFANVSIYVVRHNYTYKKQVHLIDMLVREKKLPHTSIVINDVFSRNGVGSYYGYGSYGYGFGRSRRNAYFDNERKKGVFSKVSGWFSRKK